MSSTFIPSGSYSKTSKNIESNLYCSSKERNQKWISAGLNLTSMNSANVENLDGFLMNQTGSSQNQGYIPGGSYEKTSKEMQVIMSAMCQKRDQSWQMSTLDITNVATSKTVSNIDGVLTID